MKTAAKQISAVTLGILLLTGCSAIQNSNKQQQGTVAGAAGGALLGAAVSKGSIWGVLIGAAVGGAAGNIIGNKMDRQAERIEEEVPGAQVQRIGEGINVTFDENGGVTFALNSDQLTDQSKKTLSSLAEVLREYPDTDILIEGHTDSSGDAAYNMTLSKKRAGSVVSYLQSAGVSSARLTSKWYGEEQPKFDNATPEGRAKNRRVELAITANDKMVEDAKDQAGN